jgi:hypothetical protein
VPLRIEWRDGDLGPSFSGHELVVVAVGCAHACRRTHHRPHRSGWALKGYIGRACRGNMRVSPPIMLPLCLLTVSRSVSVSCVPRLFAGSGGSRSRLAHRGSQPRLVCRDKILRPQPSNTCSQERPQRRRYFVFENARGIRLCSPCAHDPTRASRVHGVSYMGVETRDSTDTASCI